MGLLYISQRVETGQATLAAVCVYYVKLTNYGTVLYKWAKVHNTALCGKDASRTYKKHNFCAIRSLGLAMVIYGHTPPHHPCSRNIHLKFSNLVRSGAL